MKKRMSVFMLMVALVMGACCNRHIEPEPLFTKESFPLKVGNWWRYNHTNLLNGEVDTLKMKIDSFFLNGTEKCYRCVCISSNEHFNAEIRASDTMIYNTLSQSPSFPPFTLGVPFGVDSFFINRLGGGTRDTVKVLSYEKDYNLLGQKYNVFHIKESMIKPTIGTIGTNTITLSDGIGIVRIESYFDYDFGIRNYKLELIEYHIE